MDGGHVLVCYCATWWRSHYSLVYQAHSSTSAFTTGLYWTYITVFLLLSVCLWIFVYKGCNISVIFFVGECCVFKGVITCAAECRPMTTVFSDVLFFIVLFLSVVLLILYTFSHICIHSQTFGSLLQFCIERRLVFTLVYTEKRTWLGFLVVYILMGHMPSNYKWRPKIVCFSVTLISYFSLHSAIEKKMF